ncbi:MAG TPA: hypothetical protein VKN64_11440 [Halanaerobiales bacterium]|nr:hypothetical protein [Halanaerobiales bacterium]
MRINIIPRSKYGKWAIYAILAFFFFWALFYLLVEMGERGGATFFSNFKLTIPFLAAAISGIAALVMGLLSIFKSKDHCILVYISIIIGLFVLIFIMGEIIYPH